jgi:hypothetical protein
VPTRAGPETVMNNIDYYIVTIGHRFNMLHIARIQFVDAKRTVVSSCPTAPIG